MSDRLGIYSTDEVAAATQLVKLLVRVVRSFRLYEESHTTLSALLEQLRKRWNEATAGGPLHVRLTEQRVLLEDESILQTPAPNDVIPSYLYEHGVVGLIFKRGLEPDEARRLVTALAREPDASFDYASLLWEADLKHLQVLLDGEDLDTDVNGPEAFAAEIEGMAEPDDPGVGEETPEEEGLLHDDRGVRGEPAPDPDVFLVDEIEQRRLRGLVDGDIYPHTLRHALRVVAHMTRRGAAEEEQDSIRRAARVIAAAMAAGGDLRGVSEAASLGRELAGGASELERQVAQRILETLADEEVLGTFFRALDAREELDARRLAELLLLLGPEAVEPASRWLLHTRFPDEVVQALRGLGDTPARVLGPLYPRATNGDRERIARLLLDAGSAASLAPLATDFGTLADEDRLRLVNAVAHATEPVLRGVLLEALSDRDVRVRRLAIGALRRGDGPALAPVLAGLLDSGELERRPEDELRDLFATLGRVGDGALAEVLAARCRKKGLQWRLRPLTPQQQLCARALRRMRDAEALAVVEDLRRHGPKPVREILDDPLADLDA